VVYEKDEVRKIMKIRILHLVMGCWLCASAWGQVIGVDWSGSYGNNFTDTLNQGLATATTDSGDYSSDGNLDTAYLIPFGTTFSPSADKRYAAPTGKTGPLLTGTMLVHHASSMAPTNSGLYRWSAASDQNELQRTAPLLGADYDTMSMSVSYFSVKDDFLNGLTSAASIKFADQADGAVAKVSVLRNKGSGVATIAFIAQEGQEWYFAPAYERPASGNDWEGSAGINPYQAEWYAFEPTANQMLNVHELGTAKAGATFVNITAFGVIGQIKGYKGSALNCHKINFSGLSVVFQQPDGL
jgi:hypothetical protein